MHYYDSLEWIRGRIQTENPHSASATASFLREVYAHAYDCYSYDGPRRRSAGVSDLPSYVATFERFQVAAEAQKMAARMLKEHHAEEERIGEELNGRLRSDYCAAIRGRIFAASGFLTAGRRCLVTFDLPECQRDLRDRLRYFLSKAGLKRVQRSVWVTEKNVVNDLRSLFVVGALSRWVRVEVTAQN